MVGTRLAPCLLLTWLCLWGFGKGPPGPRHLQLVVGGGLQEVSEAEGGSWEPPEGPRPVLTPQRGRVELSLSGFPLLSCEVSKRRVS